MATVVGASQFQNKVYSPAAWIQSKNCVTLSLTRSLPVLMSYQAQLNLSLASMLIIPTGSETSIHHRCNILCVQMSSWRLMLKTAYAFTLLHIVTACITTLKRLSQPLLAPVADQPPTRLPACFWLPWMPGSSSSLGVWQSGDHVYLWLQERTEQIWIHRWGWTPCFPVSGGAEGAREGAGRHWTWSQPSRGAKAKESDWENPHRDVQQRGTDGLLGKGVPKTPGEGEAGGVWKGRRLGLFLGYS